MHLSYVRRLLICSGCRLLVWFNCVSYLSFFLVQIRIRPLVFPVRIALLQSFWGQLFGRSGEGIKIYPCPSVRLYVRPSVHTSQNWFPLSSLPQLNVMKLIHNAHFHKTQVKIECWWRHFTVLELCHLRTLYASWYIICVPNYHI